MAETRRCVQGGLLQLYGPATSIGAVRCNAASVSPSLRAQVLSFIPQAGVGRKGWTSRRMGNWEFSLTPTNKRNAERYDIINRTGRGFPAFILVLHTCAISDRPVRLPGSPQYTVLLLWRHFSAVLPVRSVRSFVRDESALVRIRFYCTVPIEKGGDRKVIHQSDNLVLIFFSFFYFDDRFVWKSTHMSVGGGDGSEAVIDCPNLLAIGLCGSGIGSRFVSIEKCVVFPFRRASEIYCLTVFNYQCACYPVSERHVCDGRLPGGWLAGHRWVGMSHSVYIWGNENSENVLQVDVF